MLKSREIARRFHTLCGEVFPEPEALVSDVPALVALTATCARGYSWDRRGQSRVHLS